MKRPGFRALGRAREGATAMEFGIVGPVFFLLIFGMIELGRLLWVWEVLQASAAETSRCIAISSSLCSSASTYAVSFAKGLGVSDVQAANVTKSTITLGTNATSFTKITISYTFNSSVARLIKISTSGVALTGTGIYPNSS